MFSLPQLTSIFSGQENFSDFFFKLEEYRNVEGKKPLKFQSQALHSED